MITFVAFCSQPLSRRPSIWNAYRSIPALACRTQHQCSMLLIAYRLCQSVTAWDVDAPNQLSHRNCLYSWRQPGSRASGSLLLPGDPLTSTTSRSRPAVAFGPWLKFTRTSRPGLFSDFAAARRFRRRFLTCTYSRPPSRRMPLLARSNMNILYDSSTGVLHLDESSTAGLAPLPRSRFSFLVYHAQCA